MKAKRWRVKAMDQSPCELIFREGIDRAELQQLYPGCYVEPIADAAAPPSKEADDET